MSRRPVDRGSPPLAMWALFAVSAAAILLSIGLAVWAWFQAATIRDLGREVETLRLARQEAESQAALVHSLEDRLRNVEAADPGRQIAALEARVDSMAGQEETGELEVALAGIQATVSDLQTGLDNLAARILSLESAAGLSSEVRLDVPKQRQTHNLSCESSAAAMAAAYHGILLSEAEVLAALPRDPNPHLGFRGSVDGSPGGLEDYGVYDGPIQEILNSRGLHAQAVAGGLSGIRAALSRDNPVVAWITYNCQPGDPVVTTIANQEVILVPYQHAVVLTGYNAEGLWANDPWDGQEDFYRTADLERCLAYFGNMAIEVAAP